MVRIADACFSRSIPYVSFYAFSTENKFRSPTEVEGLKKIMEDELGGIIDKLSSGNIRLNVMGDISYFGERIRGLINEGVERTATLTGGVLNIALNYGGRDEIARASRLCGEKPIENFLYTAGQPDPDILVRTGGEKRLSNFMLYQLAYTELFFLDTYWPDFGEEELNTVIDEYYKRNRRFGR